MKKYRFNLSANPAIPVTFLLLTLLTLASCKKNISESQIYIYENIQTRVAAVPAYIFDWETATHMPSMPNANLVPMPWSSGTSAIDPNIVDDHKKNEGWELVWNTFSPDIQLNDPGYSYFFALYNKYRGLLRFYLWQTAAPIATNYINHGLKLYGAQTSPILNFNTQEIVSPINQTSFSQILNQQISLSGGTWLAFQYEMAYDPTMSNTTFPSFGLEWDAKWASVSQITLNGTNSGDIKGYVGNPNTSPFSFNSFLTKSTTTLFGASGYASYLQLLNPEKNTYTESMGNALNGIVKNFFNGILGGAASSQPVNLTINTKVKLDGSLVASGGLINKKLVLPGQSNSQTADGNTPYFNDVMGIMNISNAPTVNNDIYYHQIGPWPEPPYYDLFYEEKFTLDNTSFSIIWNPSIINSSVDGASIENLNIQMVQTNTPYNPNGGTGGYHPINQGSSYSFANGVICPLNGTFSSIENVGNFEVVASIPNSGIPLQLFSDYYGYGLENGVRISFDVVPNNGAIRSKIVKTFKSNIIENKHF